MLFPSGPSGAHKLTNHSTEPTRLLLVSNFAMPRGAVQLDSGKMMIRWGTATDESRWFRIEDATRLLGQRTRDVTAACASIQECPLRNSPHAAI